MIMKGSVANERLRAAVERANETADRIREMSSELLRRSDGTEQEDGMAQHAAGALATLSHSLELAAESARVSGLALRDRGRDASKAVTRGERLIRERGFKGAAAHVAMRSRQRNTLLVLAGGGLMAILALQLRKSRQE